MEQPQIGEEKIWVKFTYFDEDIRILTRIFRKSNVRVAFSVNNTIKKKCERIYKWTNMAKVESTA
jgi:hypothetical protein